MSQLWHMGTEPDAATRPFVTEDTSTTCESATSSIQRDAIQEHRIEVTEQHPNRCTPNPRCAEHAGHVHGQETAEHRHHETVPHGDYMDYLHEPVAPM